MKIVHLRAENIKNIKAIDITPREKAVVLSGKNGAGKSAVLDSIFMALTGKKCERPIRDGEKRAEISVDLGDYFVKRVYTLNSERLELTGKDGSRPKTPQALLDSIIGDISFDPLAFSFKTPAQQRDILLKITGIDIERIDEERSAAYMQRRFANQEVDRLKGEFRALGESYNLTITKETPREEINVSAESIKLEELMLLNAEQVRLQGKIAQLDDEIHEAKQETERLKDLLIRAEGALAHKRRTRESLSLDVSPRDISSEMAALREKIEKADETNRVVRAIRAIDGVKSRLNEAEARAKAEDDKVRQADEKKLASIKNAKYPIPGLSVEDYGISYNGIPYSQLSQGQKIRVSTAMAMSLNPRVRVIFIRDASLLDKDGMSEIEALAADKDYQLWVEKVDETGNVGIYIQDGEIFGVETPQQKEKKPFKKGVMQPVVPVTEPAQDDDPFEDLGNNGVELGDDPGIIEDKAQDLDLDLGEPL